MKLIRNFFTGMLLLCSVTTIAQTEEGEPTFLNRSGLELYEWFEVEGALSIELSQHDANAIVEHALKSGDEQLIHHAVMGMAIHGSVATGWRERITRRPYNEPIPLRMFHEVPNLKNFLLSYYREGVIRDGIHFEPELVIVNGIGWFKYPAWSSAPSILAKSFPGDPEIHDFLFEAYSNGGQENIVNWLSIGKFRTPEANAHRIENLGREKFGFSSKMAAEALGEFQTPSGLQALKQALHPDHRAVLEIAKAIVSYGEETMSPEVLEFARNAQHDERPWVQQAVQTIVEGRDNYYY